MRSLAAMEAFTVLDRGWGAGLKYGAGLELECGSTAPGMASSSAAPNPVRLVVETSRAIVIRDIRDKSRSGVRWG